MLCGRASVYSYYKYCVFHELNRRAWTKIKSTSAHSSLRKQIRGFLVHIITGRSGPVALQFAGLYGLSTFTCSHMHTKAECSLFLIIMISNVCFLFLVLLSSLSIMILRK
jgi:hypothetical protein